MPVVDHPDSLQGRGSAVPGCRGCTAVPCGEGAPFPPGALSLGIAAPAISQRRAQWLHLAQLRRTTPAPESPINLPRRPRGVCFCGSQPVTRALPSRRGQRPCSKSPADRKHRTFATGHPVAAPRTGLAMLIELPLKSGHAQGPAGWCQVLARTGVSPRAHPAHPVKAHCIQSLMELGSVPPSGLSFLACKRTLWSAQSFDLGRAVLALSGEGLCCSASALLTFYGGAQRQPVACRMSHSRVTPELVLWAQPASGHSATQPVL